MSRAPYPALANPIAGNPVESRADARQALIDLLDPLVPHLSEDGARVRLGSAGAGFSVAAQELEGWARPLWGLVPHLAGGGEWGHAERWLAGLDAGTDPEHPEYWGPVRMVGQRMVEMAAIGFALAWIPDRIWDPLDGAAKDRVVAWLQGIIEHEPVDNNWQFFRVLVALGLDRIGADYDTAPVTASLEMLDGFHRGGGWYEDGSNETFDHYIPMAFHVYGLIYAATPGADPAWGERFTERAVMLAEDLQHWYDPDGAALPFGRSLTYRFALASFWGALVFADVQALPWARTRGLWLRHLRWWTQWPISDRDGVLSIGHGYGSAKMAEEYNSPGSPYWACKWFLGLAAGDDHPVWDSEEDPLTPTTAPIEQHEPGLVITRDASQVVALSGRHGERPFEQGEAKYARFAYSSAMGFAGRFPTRFGTPADSMLTLVDVDGVARVRAEIEDWELRDGCVWSRWSPWDDVTVQTVLWGQAPWHVRLHRIRTARPLRTVEAGFCLPWAGWDDTETVVDSDVGRGRAVLGWNGYLSGILTEDPTRRGQAAMVAPNANVLHPRTLLPELHGSLEPGRHDLAVTVVGTDQASSVDLGGDKSSIPAAAWGLLREI